MLQNRTPDPVKGGPLTLLFAPITAVTAATAEIVAAVTGKSIYVVGYTLVASGTVTITWKSATTALSGAMALAAQTTVTAHGTLATPVLGTASGEALNLTLAQAVQVSGHVAYYVA